MASKRRLIQPRRRQKQGELANGLWWSWTRSIFPWTWTFSETEYVSFHLEGIPSSGTPFSRHFDDEELGGQAQYLCRLRWAPLVSAMVGNTELNWEQSVSVSSEDTNSNGGEIERVDGSGLELSETVQRFENYRFFTHLTEFSLPFPALYLFLHPSLPVVIISILSKLRSKTRDVRLWNSTGNMCKNFQNFALKLDSIHWKIWNNIEANIWSKSFADDIRTQ